MSTKMVVVTDYTGCIRRSGKDRKAPRIGGGVVQFIREATPADHAAAHPKCGTCKYYAPEKYNKTGLCQSLDQPHFYAVDPVLDYCRHHPELTAKAAPAAETDAEDYNDWGESDFDVDPDLGAK